MAPVQSVQHVDSASDADQAERDAFFEAVRHLEALNKACGDKRAFICKVLSGAEAVNWGIIDRCREALLQLGQSAYVFTTQHARVAATDYATRDGNFATLTALRETNEAAVKEACRGINEILSWIPAAPNTRRSDGHGNIVDRR